MSTLVITADYTATLADDVILIDSTAGSVDLTLPSSFPVGKRYTVKHISGSGVASVIPASGTIDGAASFSFSVPKQAIIAHGDSTDWHIL